MKLDYSLDINQKSTWYINNPNALSKRMPFYINECGHYIADASYFTERQGQKNYLLIYTISGSGSLKYKENEYILRANTAVVIYCKNYHLYKTQGKTPWSFKWIHFNGSAAKEYFNILNYDSSNELTIINIENPNEFEKRLDELTVSFNLYDIPSMVDASAQWSMHLLILLIFTLL